MKWEEVDGKGFRGTKARNMGKMTGHDGPMGTGQYRHFISALRWTAIGGGRDMMSQRDGNDITKVQEKEMRTTSPG